MSSNYDQTRDSDVNRDRVRASDTDNKIDPETGDVIGEAAGGISGVLTGAALGSLGGPIGTIIGGIAGAVGGWWAGHAISEAATKMTHEDERFYREHYESTPSRLGDRTYDDVRPAYQLGHLASRNPDYANRDFDAVESDLQRGWTDDLSAKHGDWQSVRPYVRDSYTRGRSSVGAGGATGTDAGTAAYGAGSAAGGIDSTTDRAGDKTDNAWDKTKAGAERMGDKIERGFDSVKDRVDNNPSSRPNPDATDTDRRF